MSKPRSHQVRTKLPLLLNAVGGEPVPPSHKILAQWWCTATQLGASLRVLLQQKITTIAKWFWIPHHGRRGQQNLFSLSWDLKADLDMKKQSPVSQLTLECLPRTELGQTRL